MTRWLVIAVLACACGTSKDSPKKNAKAVKPAKPLGQIKRGVRISYRLGEVPNVDRSAALQQAVTVLRRRLRLRGVDGAVGRVGDLVVVELPGTGAATSATEQAISSGAALSFKIVHEYRRDKPKADVYAPQQLMPTLYAHVTNDAQAKSVQITGAKDQWRHFDTGEGFHDYFLQASDHNMRLRRGEANRMGCVPVGVLPDGTRLCKLSGATLLRRYLSKLAKQQPKLAVDAAHEIAFGRLRTRDGRASGMWRTYLLYRKPVLRGDAIETAKVVANPTTRVPEVLVTLTDEGRKQFARATAQNKGRRLAIVAGGEVISAPVIQTAIAGGKVAITVGGRNGQTARRAAEELAASLRGGALPARLVQERSERIGG